MSELDVSNLMTVEQAMAIIDAFPVHPRTQRVKINQSSDRFLSENLKSDRDSPPFDKSLMDGYAVRAADVSKIPCQLTIAGTVAAGGSSTSALQPGQAIAIMTGAPVPPGADAVVPVEATQIVEKDRKITITESTAIGRNIARKGHETTAGSTVLKSGTKIGPAQIAVAAAIGAVDLPVFALPYVAVLGTGDELIPPEQTPIGSQIRSCNNAMLLALLARLPCHAADLGIIHDDPAAIEAKIEFGLSHDVLLITGGMSMGERDYVPAVLKKLGANFKITKLRIKPGKPFIFAQMPDGKFAFGLPGNPISAFVCTRILVSRLIRRMAGGPAAEPTRIAPLAQPLDANGPRTFYQPAIFDGRQLTPLRWKGSADIYTLSNANALLIRTENHPAQPIGDSIELIEI
jgi:molybdopterin molybdotransferase